CVEQAFHARLAIVAGPPTEEPEPAVRRPSRGKKRSRSAVVDKTVLALPDHVAFAIGITSNQSLSNRVWSAVAVRPMPTTCALPSHRHSAARSATSSPYRSAEVIIARCIVAVTKPAGGTRPVSIQPMRLESFG